MVFCLSEYSMLGYVRNISRSFLTVSKGCEYLFTEENSERQLEEKNR